MVRYLTLIENENDKINKDDFLARLKSVELRNFGLKQFHEIELRVCYLEIFPVIFVRNKSSRNNFV